MNSLYKKLYGIMTNFDVLEVLIIGKVNNSDKKREDYANSDNIYIFNRKKHAGI